MKLHKDQLIVFEGQLPKYGGHSRWLSNVTNLDYLIVGWWDWPFQCKAWSVYYDGWHNTISFGPFSLSWGGPQSFKEE